ncbi:MAG: potassium transporter Kup [Sphingomonadales bacterium]|nr:potassium transporter Kup [Sphingomonadales bacterium]MDE2569803.1 potassium transporter Kup [Sphingomonadales bacterium]
MAADSPSTATAAGTQADHHHRHGFLALTVGAIGVVFGDIGTSPLYAFREALGQAASDGLYREEVIGVMSLALWALILIVTVKYVMFLMRADNEGEGGVLALLALAQRGGAKGGGVVLALGAIGAALFYGDAMITPSLSVLSAVEGLKSLPQVGEGFSTDHILVIALAILFSLFAIQSHGTALVSKLFGPVCIAWFLAIGAIGVIHIADDPAILAAFLPWHAVIFMTTHGVLGLFVLGAVFLTVTGAEALTADMGHFGPAPIRAAWLVLVFPALALNYLGQGAFALRTLEDANRLGQPFANLDWFFLMIPESVRLPMVLLACAATIIASQAVITGAYSLTQQAIQLGLLPRLQIKQTSAGNAGQIYIGAVNWALLAGVVALAVGFRTSSAMAAAYGIAVTGTMVVTSCLAFVVLRRQWHWRLPLAAALIVPFLAIDLLFFGANILRVVEGGWVPLLIGAMMLLVIWTWVRGRRLAASLESETSVRMDEMAAALVRRPPTEVAGTAIFLTSRGDLTPHALLHNIKHNHVLHQHNLILTVRTRRQPYVDPSERFHVERINDRFTRIEANYGFMEAPTVYSDIEASGAIVPGGGRASYFIGRNNYVPSPEVGMPFWQDLLFIALHRNAADPTDYFGIPSNRVIELGAQFTI